MDQEQKNKELIRAIERDSLSSVEQLVEEEANVNCKDENARSPLHVSLFQGSNDISRFLIERGANLGAKGKFGGTPIHMGVFKGNLEMTQLLIEKGADIKAKDNSGNTPLHMAAIYGHADVARFMINSTKPKLDDGGEEAKAPPKQDAEEGTEEEEKEKEVAPTIRALIGARNKEGETPLHLAAVKCKKAVIDLLIAEGADMTAKDKEDTPPQLYIPGNIESYFKIPAMVKCPGCEHALKLDGQEQKSGIYFCPYCEKEVDHLAYMEGKGDAGVAKEKRVAAKPEDAQASTTEADATMTVEPAEAAKPEVKEPSRETESVKELEPEPDQEPEATDTGDPADLETKGSTAETPEEPVETKEKPAGDSDPSHTGKKNDAKDEAIETVTEKKTGALGWLNPANWFGSKREAPAAAVDETKIEAQETVSEEGAGKETDGERVKLSEIIDCAKCSKSIKLHHAEQESGFYSCPYCHETIDHFNVLDD